MSQKPETPPVDASILALYGHGFHNDSSVARYDEAAARLSWQRSVNFFNHYLHG